MLIHRKDCAFNQHSPSSTSSYPKWRSHTSLLAEGNSKSDRMRNVESDLLIIASRADQTRYFLSAPAATKQTKLALPNQGTYKADRWWMSICSHTYVPKAVSLCDHKACHSWIHKQAFWPRNLILVHFPCTQISLSVVICILQCVQRPNLRGGDPAPAFSSYGLNLSLVSSKVANQVSAATRSIRWKIPWQEMWSSKVASSKAQRVPAESPVNLSNSTPIFHFIQKDSSHYEVCGLDFCSGGSACHHSLWNATSCHLAW